MTDCYFCGNHLIELVPVQKIAGSWTQAGKSGENFEWSCEHCLQQQ